MVLNVTLILVCRRFWVVNTYMVCGISDEWLAFHDDKLVVSFFTCLPQPATETCKTYVITAHAGPLDIRQTV